MIPSTLPTFPPLRSVTPIDVFWKPAFGFQPQKATVLFLVHGLSLLRGVQLAMVLVETGLLS